MFKNLKSILWFIQKGFEGCYGNRNMRANIQDHELSDSAVQMYDLPGNYSHTIKIFF